MADLQWRIEVWSLPDDPDGFRLLDTPDVISAHTGDRDDAVGAGEITLPADYPYLDQIIQVDPEDLTATKSSLITFWRPGAATPDFEFYAEDMTEDLENSVVTVKGQEIRGGLDDAIVYPKPDTEGDWIWGGENALPDLRLASLGNVRSEWDVYLERERYGLSITATGGTFTFSFNGNDTDTIGVDPSAATIKSRLEALPGITTVYAVKHEDDSFTVVILNPTDLPSDITINTGGLTGGSASWTKHADGFDSSSNPTFTLEVETGDGTDETDPIAWNASAATVEAALQALDNVDDVTVVGEGTFEDPWHIIFYSPPVATDITCNFSAGDSVVSQAVEGGLDPSPVTRSQFADERVDPLVHGSANLQVSVTTNPADLDDGASWALRVPASAQFDGSQVVFRVTPGQVYQASIRVKPTVAGRYRLVIRDRFEGLIKWTTPTEVPLSAGTYQTLTVPDVRIPDGVTEVIMRVAVVSSNPSEIDTFYVNWEHARFEEGLPATTAGGIVQHVRACWTPGTCCLGWTRRRSLRCWIRTVTPGMCRICGSVQTPGRSSVPMCSVICSGWVTSGICVLIRCRRKVSGLATRLTICCCGIRVAAVRVLTLRRLWLSAGWLRDRSSLSGVFLVLIFWLRRMMGRGRGFRMPGSTGCRDVRISSVPSMRLRIMLPRWRRRRSMMTCRICSLRR